MGQKYISIKNYEKYQHYKDRNPTWVKLYWDILSDDKFVMLNLENRSLYLHLILLASRHENLIPFDLNYIRLQLKLHSEPNLKPLMSAGFLLARCKPGPSAALEQRSQNAMALREEKEREKEIEKDKSNAHARKRLTDEEFLATLRANPAYQHINLDIELGKMDAWLLEHPGREKSRKFVLNWLNKIQPPLPAQAQKRGPVKHTAVVL